MQNFRPLGSLFIVEVEFLCGVRWCGMNSYNHVKPNLKLRLGCGYDNFEKFLKNAPILLIFELVKCFFFKQVIGPIIRDLVWHLQTSN